MDADTIPPCGTEVPDEEPTAPDLATYPCPWCVGEDGKPSGLVLDLSGWGSAHRAVTKKCPECRGGKAVNREQFARWQATRRGRPR